jgi:hypothetical protein
MACSGDKNPENPGEPESGSGSPLAVAARQIPKSVSRGRCSASRMFEGLRFRCTTPAAWMAPRPSASPATSVGRFRAGTGPCSRTRSASDGPATCAVASQGTSPSRSESTTGTTNAPLTRPAAATSDRNWARNQGSEASPARITRTSTVSPVTERPRNTCPRPSWRSSPSSRYGPAARGWSDVSGATTLIPTLSGSSSHSYQDVILRPDCRAVYAPTSPARARPPSKSRDRPARPAAPVTISERSAPTVVPFRSHS